jgi:hypothetical protein
VFRLCERLTEIASVQSAVEIVRGRRQRSLNTETYLNRYIRKTIGRIRFNHVTVSIIAEGEAKSGLNSPYHISCTLSWRHPHP